MTWLWTICLLEGLFMVGVLAQAGLAALARMRVELISFGYGPRLARAGRVQIAMFPLGGYVRVAGLHPTEATVDSSDRRAFFNRPWPLRALVVLGWPIGVLLVVIVATAGSLLVFGSRSFAIDVASVAPGSPAESAGLRAGDEVVAIDGVPPGAPGDVSQRVMVTGGRPFTVEVKRAGQRRSLSLTAIESEPGVYRIGVTLTTRPVRAPVSFPGAVAGGARDTIARMGQIADNLFEVVTGREKTELEGPVGITAMLGARRDPPEGLELSIISGTHVALYSLFPLPPLPGGQLLLLLFGWRSRRLRSAEAARDLGAVDRTSRPVPRALLAALLSLLAVAAIEIHFFLDLGGPLLLALAGALPGLLIAGALALRLPRAWAWGVYVPLLEVPSAVVRVPLMSPWIGVVGIALLLVIPAALLLPHVRRAFGRECPLCHRLAAAPVRSSARTSCLACGSSYSPRG